jgi:outer membrane protein W
VEWGVLQAVYLARFVKFVTDCQIHNRRYSRYYSDNPAMWPVVLRNTFYLKEVSMLRKLMFVAAFALLPAAAAHAQFQAGDWELTLGANAAHGPDLNGVTFAGTGSLGYFLTNEVELGLRQSVGYSDVTQNSGGSSWNASTRIALDYHFDLNRWQPYVGANIGYVYGDGVNDTFEAAPEAGIKFFVNSTTFIQFGVEYQFFFDKGSDATQAFSDGQFVYGLNIGFRWK